MSTLILAAHPDDEVLGCGGTAARLAAGGEDVFIAIFGEGVTSRAERREDAPADEVAQLGRTAGKVARLLGAQDVFLYGFPDNRFDTVPVLEIAKKIEDLIARLAPGTVFTQHGGDLNIDHERLFRAALAATRPLPGSPVKTVYAYEVASSTEWAFGQFSPRFMPDTFFDITATLETKIRAMALYESEARAFPHPRSPEALRAAARRLGGMAGVGAAEAFQLIRRIV